MIGYKSNLAVYEIGVGYMPPRKKPCLIVKCGNTETKYASFNDEYSAREFMNIFASFVGAPLINWNGDDIPMGLVEDLDKCLGDIINDI